MRRLVIVGLAAVAACALVLAAANAIVLLSVRGDVVKDPAEAPRAEAALVLGAQV